MTEPITRERVDDLRGSREKMLLLYQLVTALKSRFPTITKFKKGSAAEQLAMYHGCSNAAETLCNALPEFINSTVATINGMEAILANNDVDRTLRRLSLNSDERG